MTARHQDVAGPGTLGSPGMPDVEALEGWYRELHTRPELAGQERATSDWLTRLLRGWGLDVRTGIGGHGLLTFLRNGPGPVVVLRAELDALRVGGTVIHACGHDLHMSAALAAVRALQADLPSWRGTLVLLLQPAEETGTGARAMVRDGLAELLPSVDAVLALHTSALPVGQVTFRPGQMTSAGLDVQVEFVGGSGHVAFGSEGPTALDAAVDWVHSLREDRPAGVTVGALNGGTSANVMPDRACAQVSVRGADLGSCRDGVRELRARAHQMAAGLSTRIRVRGTFAPVVNGHEVGDTVYRALGLAGEQVYLLPEPAPTCDDIGLLAEHLNASLCYWFVGCMDPADFDEDDLRRIQLGRQPRRVPGHHSPGFRPSTAVLPVAARQLQTAARSLLGVPGTTRG